MDAEEETVLYFMVWGGVFVCLFVFCCFCLFFTVFVCLLAYLLACLFLRTLREKIHTNL